MKLPVYNLAGEKTKEIELSSRIFGVKVKPEVVHQVVIAQQANSRQVLAHTKDKSEVRGGGKKPWKQKGTGRARHGSSRSPIWKGGGVTHGPRTDRIFAVEIPKKMRRKALFMVLSQKAKEANLIVLDKIELEKGKTKEMARSLAKLPCKGASTLIALPNYDKKIFLASRNIKKVLIDDARNLNVLDLLNSKYLLMPKETIKTIEKIFIK